MSQLRGHDAVSEVVAKRFIDCPWRVGRKVPRNLYVNPSPDGEDGTAFGQVDASWLAEHIVELHNTWLEGRRNEGQGDEGV